MAVGWFYLSVVVLCSLGSMCILSTIYWMRSWQGGFAWDGTMLMFNWHPVLMVTGMVVVYSAGEYRSAEETWCGLGPYRAALSRSILACVTVGFRAMGVGWGGLFWGPGVIWRKKSCKREHLRRVASWILLDRGWRTFPVKGQTVNTLGFASPMICVATTQLCYCVVRAAMDHTETCSCVPIKLYL